MGARPRGRRPRGGQRERRAAPRDPEPLRAGRAVVARRGRAIAGPLPDAASPIHGAPAGRIEAGIDAGERMALRRRSAPAAPAVGRVGRRVGRDARAGRRAHPRRRPVGARHRARLSRPGAAARRRSRHPSTRVGCCAPTRGSRAATGIRAFLDATRDDARVIVGNRSTVYAPAARLGLIAIWDDGDSAAQRAARAGRAPARRRTRAPGAERGGAAPRRRTRGASRWSASSRSAGCTTSRPSATRSRRIIPTEQQATPEPGSARIPSAAWRQAQEAVREGPVLVQVARPGNAPALACDRCREPARCVACGGALAVPRSGGEPRCVLCGTSAGAWRCPVCDGTKLRAVTIGASRTAEELGRAFPKARVILSDGERPVLRVGAEPALVVATRGAEPIADGRLPRGAPARRRADAAAGSLRVAEDCLRWWSNAAALAAPGAPVFLVGVGGALATALAHLEAGGVGASGARDPARVALPARRARRERRRRRGARSPARWTRSAGGRRRRRAGSRRARRRPRARDRAVRLRRGRTRSRASCGPR